MLGGVDDFPSKHFTFNEATKGWDCPAGHAVINPNDGPFGTAG
jgi:hypothetical protein